jgi:diguanylate cyclase (GGDEF)-like protein
MYRVVLLAAVVLAAIPAQGFRLPIKMYRNADGLPQEQVRDIVQDSVGRLYIGTVGGIGIYNGREFARLGVRQGLPAEDILSLAVDARDRVWIGTLYGLAVLEDGAARIVSTPDYIGASIARVEAGDGLYFQHGQGVYLYRNGEFSIVSLGGVQTFTLGAEGAVYIAAAGRLRILRKGGETVHPLEGTGTVNVLALRRDGSLLVGAQNGLFAWAGGRTRALLEGTPVLDCMEDSEGDLWAASEVGGLHHYSRGKWNRYSYIGDVRLNQAYCLFEDRERNVWFGTVSGMGKVPYRQFGIYDTQDGLPEFMTASFYEDPRGVLRQGYMGGVSVYDPIADRFAPERLDLPTEVTVRAMGTDRKGRLILGSADHGLFIREGERLRRVEAAAGFAVSRVYDMLEDPRNGLWIATRAGLLLWDGEEFRLFTSAQGLPSNTCYGLALDPQGRLFVSTQKGVAAMEGAGFVVPPPLRGVTCEVNTIQFGSDGRLWIGTHGFGLMELEGEILRVHDESRGFPNDFIWGLAEDGQGALWVASNKGIHRREGERWLTFNSKDGLPGDEIFIHTARRDHRGDIWFGLPFGIVRVFAGFNRVNTVLPGLRVDRLVTGRGAYAAGTGPLELRADERDLRFEYTAFSFQNESQVLYRTRLEPLEPSWSSPTAISTLHYPGLGPGRYRFLVQACNNSFLWTEAPAVLEFRIRPYFYETWWFKVLIGLAVLLVVAGGLLLRLRAVTRARDKLERLVAQRTEELKGKVEIIESLSRTDPLTNVYNRRYFVDRFEQVVAYSKRYGEPFCFVIIDMDNFKAINDTRGHLVGDEILMEFANLLKDGFRETDILARYGGDEFVVLMQKTEPQGVRLRVENFLQKLRDHIFAGDQKVRLTFSAGIAYVWPQAAEQITFDWVAGTADRFMYEAKQAGKNCVLFREIKAS